MLRRLKNIFDTFRYEIETQKLHMVFNFDSTNQLCKFENVNMRKQLIRSLQKMTSSIQSKDLRPFFMNTNTWISFIVILLSLIPSLTHAKTTEIFFQVDMTAIQGPITTVAVRGAMAPLSWETDFQLKDEDQDGIYTGRISIDSPYRYLRFKFVLNGLFELENGDNRMMDLRDYQSVIYQYNRYYALDQGTLDAIRFSPEQIEEDIRVLQATLEYIHPGLYNYQSKSEFVEALSTLEADMKSNPSLQNVYCKISEFIANIRCSHTFSNPYNQKHRIQQAFFFQEDKLPLTFTRADRQFLIDRFVTDNPQISKGLEIEAINGVPMSTIMESLVPFIAADGSNHEKKWQRLTMSGQAKVELFDLYYPLVYGSSGRFQLRLKDYVKDTVYTTEVRAITKYERDQGLQQKYPDFTTDFESGLSFEIMEGRLGKMTINSFANFNSDYNFEAFVQSSIQQMKDQNIEHFVIDIRQNEGGNSDPMEYLLEQILQEEIIVQPVRSTTAYKKIPDTIRPYITTWDKRVYNQGWKVQKQGNREYKLRSILSGRKKRYKPSKQGFKGKVYLLVSAENSSATHIMATYVKRHQLATIIGQETGGNQKGLNAGVLFFTTLPNTQIELDIPVYNIQLGAVGENTRDGGILPDYTVVREARDIALGIDPELKKVWELIDNEK